MAAWFPIIKVVLPYVAPIFRAALPAFTKEKSEKADPIVAQKISELQTAVKTNSESSRALAKAIEEVAELNDKVIKRARQTAAIATALQGRQRWGLSQCPAPSISPARTPSCASSVGSRGYEWGQFSPTPLSADGNHVD